MHRIWLDQILNNFVDVLRKNDGEEGDRKTVLKEKEKEWGKERERESRDSKRYIKRKKKTIHVKKRMIARENDVMKEEREVDRKIIN